MYFLLNDKEIKNNIYIPKYYDPEVHIQLKKLKKICTVITLEELIDNKKVSVSTGNEIGKMAYGTGNIPFIRTSDLSNWEIKAVPKQGVSLNIYKKYAAKQDIQANDILLVKDGTYLIGTSCFITDIDLPMLFQSHLLRFRALDKDYLDSYYLFLALNSTIVQKQLRDKQFSSDIIDTIGDRYKEIYIPIIEDANERKNLSKEFRDKIKDKIRFRAAIRQFPFLIEEVLKTGSTDALDKFLSQDVDVLSKCLKQETTTQEMGSFSCFTIKESNIKEDIYIPKYYDPFLNNDLKDLESTCLFYKINDLIKNKYLVSSTGDEIGKMAYGTGDIPFVRTSDFSNWEIFAKPKQGVSEKIYQKYAKKQDVKEGDILIVRDGTYLVGSSCIITKDETKLLYCGGLIKLRSLDHNFINPYLLLGLLNSSIVKRQIRAKQFSRDVIETLGTRFGEIILPIPKDIELRKDISFFVSLIIRNRIVARDFITNLASNLFSSF